MGLLICRPFTLAVLPSSDIVPLARAAVGWALLGGAAVPEEGAREGPHRDGSAPTLEHRPRAAPRARSGDDVKTRVPAGGNPPNTFR
ncbi:hypothetical protein GCM10017667_77830 [Streptomyces filamentosus]|uniref:Uncharacterized protein n=1 Tax=Streptomyces filamentosus TaxID=67294 RepID=A0A919ETN7_STRFL|nr:hypothetical protein GCM10017667_77830 [Streptomyces filamentosus]